MQRTTEHSSPWHGQLGPMQRGIGVVVVVGVDGVEIVQVSFFLGIFALHFLTSGTMSFSQSMFSRPAEPTK